MKYKRNSDLSWCKWWWLLVIFWCFFSQGHRSWKKLQSVFKQAEHLQVYLCYCRYKLPFNSWHSSLSLSVVTIQFSTVVCGLMQLGVCVSILWWQSRRMKPAWRSSPSRRRSSTGLWPSWTAPWGGPVASPRACFSASSMISAGKVGRQSNDC